MHKIATLNKISPRGLAVLGEGYEIVEETAQADAILVRSFKMHEMDFAPSLQAIARAGAGTNNIPVDRCAREGIVVFNTPGANAQSVCELVVGALFALARHIPEANGWTEALEGDVAKAVEEGKKRFAGTEIAGKTLGVVGLGAIGSRVANSGIALGMEVKAFVRTPRELPGLSPKVEVSCDLEEVLSAADYLSIHVPMNEDNRGMIDAAAMAKMKRGAALLNFSRGELVQEEDLLRALEEGQLSAYASDFPNERLLGQDKVFLLPHLGASTEESEERCAAMAAEEVKDYLEQGNITHSVNFPDCRLDPTPEGAYRVVLLGEEESQLWAALHQAVTEAGGQVVEEKGTKARGLATHLADVSGADEETLRQGLAQSAVFKARVIPRTQG